MENKVPTHQETFSRPRRQRQDVARVLFGSKVNEHNLEINDILTILRRPENYEGGVNCRVCGKLYKSKVCLTKHLWEHSTYWSLFGGLKNHERVLSIQAAVILWQNQQHPMNQEKTSENNSSFMHEELDNLLVTSPHKKEPDHETKSTPAKSSTMKKCKESSPAAAKAASSFDVEITTNPYETPVKKSNNVTMHRRHCDDNKSRTSKKKRRCAETNEVKTASVENPYRTPEKNYCPETSQPAIKKVKNNAKRQLLTSNSENIQNSVSGQHISGHDMCSPAKALRQC